MAADVANFGRDPRQTDEAPASRAGDTIVACASATGGTVALLRLSGPRAFQISAAAGIHDTTWVIGAGSCPVRVLARRGPATATGEDLVEILVPGSADLCELAMGSLITAGAKAAGPGAFTRQALAAGRLSLDQAEGVLAVAQAPDAIAAAAALTRLRGALAQALEPVRLRLLALRAEIEAGLDFLDEHDVRPADQHATRQEIAALEQHLRRWLVVADGLGGNPVVCLVGAPNAGKSALFSALTGESALISPLAGTTRDTLHGTLLHLAEQPGPQRTVRVIDTAGWLSVAAGVDAAGVDAAGVDAASVDAAGLDEAAVTAGAQEAASATLIVACAAPDAPLPDPLPASKNPHQQRIVIATKCDLGVAPDPRAVLAVSATTGVGLAALTALLHRLLAPVATAEPRQQRLLKRAADALARGGQLLSDSSLTEPAETDVLLADDLRRAAEDLGELLGPTTPDAVLDAIFQRFCIGK